MHVYARKCICPPHVLLSHLVALLYPCRYSGVGGGGSYTDSSATESARATTLRTARHTAPRKDGASSCAVPISGTLLLWHHCADVAVWSPHATITACAWTMTSVIALCAITPIIVLHALALAGQAPRKVGEAAAGTNLPHVPAAIAPGGECTNPCCVLLVLLDCGVRSHCLLQRRRRYCSVHCFSRDSQLLRL